ncbi:MAG: phage tail assembly chaperone [Oscillospiraceae bacterium]|nr:phage tail assembly chaperone [Oscillospiraceae bacterium]
MKKLIYKIKGYTATYNPKTDEVEQQLSLAGATVENPTEEEIARAANLAYNGEYTIDDVPDPPMTADEARAKRGKLLAETEWTQVLDAPISAECREAFRVYRQALRDITEQEGFPEVIEWPAMPEVVKAAPDPVDTAVDVLLGGEEA